MAGKSPVVADEGQRRALAGLARSRDRGEADRARAILLTLPGWRRPRLRRAVGARGARGAVGWREALVGLGRVAFMRHGVAALRTRPPPGPAPTKAERALEVAGEVLARPGADRPARTPPAPAGQVA